MLIDPVSHGDDPLATLAPVAEVLATDEWVLHAADQDLPCLAEIGMRPPKLYDTELAGRLAAFDRVNLAAMVQRLLGLQLMKGHGAADWSKRPLPRRLAELRRAGRRGAARAARRDRRRSSRSRAKPTGPHRNSNICAHSRPLPRGATGGGARRVSTRYATRGRWPRCGSCGQTRDHIARRRDIAPGRILPDAAIVNAATVDPDTVEKLTALPVFGGNRQRRSAQVWLDALGRARTAEIRRRLRSRRTDRRLRRVGAGANPRRPPGWRPPARV